MASSWLIRHRSSKGRSIEEYYKLDPDKSDAQNVYDIVALLADATTNEPKRLCLLNALAKVFKRQPGDTITTTNDDCAAPVDDFGFTVRELFQVISVHLYHHFTQIRAAALRALRHLVRTPDDLVLFNALQLPDLVCRSLDILLKNDEERAQALKLIRRMLIVDPLLIVPSVVRCLVSLSEGGAESGDRMLRSCLAVLCEFGVLHPKLLICCGGVSAITRNVLEFLSPRIAESLCGVLLHLLEWPETRSIAGVRLDCLAAPYCDFTYRAGIMDKNKDARDLRFTCSRLALLSILRSWSGIIEFCDPSRASGLKAIVDILYLNQLEVRKAVLDLLYELLSIPQPVWTDEFSVAFATIDPSDFQDAWRLSEGFVAVEGRSILPTLAKSGPNVCEIHTAMLLYCFLESGLMDALVEVIVSSDTFISVRATVLLGKLTHLMHRLLPADICAASATLPTLIGYATKNNHQATAAVAALQAYHQMLKNRPASCSLFLDCIVRSGDIVRSRAFRREINTKESQVPLQANTRHGPVTYHRINSQELSERGSGMLSSSEMNSRTFLNELKRRRRHNSSGSNSIENEVEVIGGGTITQMNSSVMTSGTGNVTMMSTSASGPSVLSSSFGAATATGMTTTTTSGGATLKNTIPTLKRTGSMKLNKVFQIIDPYALANRSLVNFIVDNREVVHLNTEREQVEKLIKDSQVMTVNESWDWDIVVLIFKTNQLLFMQRMDELQLKFLRRIVEFFKPSSNRFSHSELMLGRMVAQSVHAGVELIDWFMRMSVVLEYLIQRHPTGTQLSMTTRHLCMVQTQFHTDCVKYLREFVNDLHHHLDAILVSKSAHDCLFSPQHMMSTMCQQYFLFIGRFCQTDFGVQLLTKSGIFTTLEKIVATTNHICYIKLIVTALDYSQPCAEQTRHILALALRESKVLAGRLYATQFLLVLMRARIANFHQWGVRLLVEQATKSRDKSVCLAAMEILEEACHDETYLREMIELWPEFSVDMCGDSATLLRSHFYSQVAGLEHARADVPQAVDMWERRGYCKRYVLLVEAETHASQTLHSKNEDGTYCRRSFSTRPMTVPANVLPHLYGQLVRTRQGCALLKEHCNLRRHLDTILANDCVTEENVLQLKSSLYAVGNMMTCELGVELLKTYEKFERVVLAIVEFVKYNEVYSVRATSLNVLGLIGSTDVGANVLYEMDWLCVRHNRNTMWPVSDQEEFYAQMLLWNNSKHVHEEGMCWPPYNFNALSDLDGSSPRPLDSLVGTAGTDDSDAVDGPGKAGGGTSGGEASGDGKRAGKLNSSTQSMDVSPRMPSTGGGSSVASVEIIKSPKHHVRSLSESKTTDGLHMWSHHGHGGQVIGGGVVGAGGGGGVGANPNAGLGLMFLGSRQRINSGTDSNTSGVSSCDSTYGRNNFISDLQQTLSPIPSTSDLLEYRKLGKPNFERYNRWCEEQFRKISLTGLPVRDVKINPQDVHGYAKIRHIKRNQRPVLSESAAEDLMKVVNVGVYEDEPHQQDEDEDDIPGSGDDYRLARASMLMQQQMTRNLKVRSLDRQQSTMVTSQNSILKIRESSELSVQSTESLTSLSSKVITTATPPPVEDLLELSSDLADYRLDEVATAATAATVAKEANQPCYMGICLPRNILNLFPRRVAGKPYVAIDLDTELTPGVSGVAGTTTTAAGEVDVTDHVLVAATKVSSSITTSSGTSEKTVASAVEPIMKLCLNCSRTGVIERNPTLTTKVTSTANIATKTSSCNNSNHNFKSNSNSTATTTTLSSSSGTSVTSTPLTTSSLTATASSLAPLLSSSSSPTTTSSTPLPVAVNLDGDLSKHHKKLIMLRNVTDSKRVKGSMLSADSSATTAATIADEEEDRTLLAILVNVQRCANPVLMKQAKLNLLELKQKHAEYFQDLCLYSEVLKAIGRNTYRQSSRRFLQELFLDIDFEELLRELMHALNVTERQPKGCQMGALPRGSSATSYGSMIHAAGVELRNGKRECEKIEEEEMATATIITTTATVTMAVSSRKSLPEPIVVSPSRSSTASGESEVNGGPVGGVAGSSSLLGKGFARVPLSCSVNKFPVKRDRANSLNTPSTTATSTTMTATAAMATTLRAKDY